jgi:hypothetical protein
LADVPHDLITSVALGYTAGQCRRGSDVSAVCFPLQDDRIVQRSALAVWTAAVCASTVTVSVRAPTDSVRSPRLTRSFAKTFTSFCSNFLNPAACTVSR